MQNVMKVHGVAHLLMLALMLLALMPALPAAAQSGTCECIAYVQNRLGINPTGTDAAQAGAVLVQRDGFTRVTTPKPGDVAIFQQGLYGAGNTGHIVILTAVADAGNDWRLTFDGSNQPGTQRTEANCTNVTTQGTTVGKNDGRISYYRRNSTPVIASGSRVTIRSVHSGHVIDVRSRGTADRTIVQQSRANNGLHQIFIVERVTGEWYALRPAHATRSCLDVRSRSTSNGAVLQISRCHFKENQQFRFEAVGNGQYAIIARHSNAAIDVTDWSTGSGKALQMWSQHLNQANQRWTLQFR